jgi:hypothetical protein
MLCPRDNTKLAKAGSRAPAACGGSYHTPRCTRNHTVMISRCIAKALERRAHLSTGFVQTLPCCVKFANHLRQLIATTFSRSGCRPRSCCPAVTIWEPLLLNGCGGALRDALAATFISEYPRSAGPRQHARACRRRSSAPTPLRPGLCERVRRKHCLLLLPSPNDGQQHERLPVDAGHCSPAPDRQSYALRWGVRERHRPPIAAYAWLKTYIWRQVSPEVKPWAKAVISLNIAAFILSFFVALYALLARRKQKSLWLFRVQDSAAFEGRQWQ